MPLPAWPRSGAGRGTGRNLAARRHAQGAQPSARRRALLGQDGRRLPHEPAFAHRLARAAASGARRLPERERYLRPDAGAALGRLVRRRLHDPRRSHRHQVAAAQMLTGIPPGARRSFAFEKFKGFAREEWQAIKGDFKPNSLPSEPTIFGSDISGDMIVMARNNLQQAGIPFEVPLKQIEAQEIKPPTERAGIILTNPPYGERIGLRGDSTQPADDMAAAFFSAFGTTLKQRFAGWQVNLITAGRGLPKLLRLKEARKTPFFNGALECRLFRFDMVAGFNRREAAKPKQR